MTKRKLLITSIHPFGLAEVVEDLTGVVADQVPGMSKAWGSKLRLKGETQHRGSRYSFLPLGGSGRGGHWFAETHLITGSWGHHTPSTSHHASSSAIRFGTHFPYSLNSINFNLYQKQWSLLLGRNACLGRSCNSGRVDLKYSLLVFALVRHCASSHRDCPWKEACNATQAVL